jgi:hypothetical protein
MNRKIFSKVPGAGIVDDVVEDVVDAAGDAASDAATGVNDKANFKFKKPDTLTAGYAEQV